MSNYCHHKNECHRLSNLICPCPVQLQTLDPILRHSCNASNMTWSHFQMFLKTGVLKNVENFKRKHLCWILFLIKLQAFRKLIFAYIGIFQRCIQKPAKHLRWGYSQKKLTSWKLPSIFANGSILYVWQGSGYASVF